jgi:hypothetical protein
MPFDPEFHCDLETGNKFSFDVCRLISSACEPQILKAVEGLLKTDVVVVGENRRYVLLTVRISRDLLARSQHIISALSDYAGDIDYRASAFTNSGFRRET